MSYRMEVRYCACCDRPCDETEEMTSCENCGHVCLECANQDGYCDSCREQQIADRQTLIK